MMRTTASIQDAMRILAGEYDLPGPFTILQGMGDGMANTIDTMPQLVVGNQNHSEGEGIHDEGAGRDGNVDDNADQSSGTESNGVDHEQLSFGSVPREISERDGSNASSSNTDRRSVSINGRVNENGNDNSNSRENSEADLFSIIGGSGSESSSVDVLSIGSHHDPIVANSAASASASASAATTRTKDARASDNRATLNHGSRISPRRDRTTRIGNGLHLPIPTGVAPIGYNSILPPVTTNLNLPPHPRSPQRSNDEYIMVDDRNITREIIPIDAGDADANANSPADQCPELQYETPEPSSTNTRYNLLSTQNHQSIKEWDLISRENETMELGEVLLRPSSNPLTLLSGNQWWKSRRHRLFIFDEPPSFQPSQAVNISTDRKTRANRYLHAHDSEHESDEWHLHHGQIRGELAPGSTVVGVEILSISHPRKMRPKNNQSSKAGVGVIEVLKIDSPREGYIVYSVDGYPFVGPGLPSTYTESNVWLWKVTCPNGAYVRQGLELTSAQVDTISFGSFVQIKRKAINAMGLSRLKVEAFVRTESDADANAKHATGGGATRLDTALQSFSWRSQSSSKNPVQKKQSQQLKKIVGWISEVLNPLSGQNGPIVQPIPFPIPSQYRVTLPEGAVIREGIELSSNQIGHAPFGSLLSIVGQGFSQHPMERCIQRLKLAGGGGWVSVQLNSQSPEDQFSILEQVGTDGSFEPDEPGFFHIEKQLKVIDEYHANVDDPDDSNLEHRTNVRQSLERLISSVSSINDEDDTAENTADISNNDSSMASSAIPTLFRSGVANHSGSQTMLKCGSKQLQDEPCLICLTEERNATIVHGETGHIACCLTCARLLKGRGDKCPVCRLPIDMIIQQFWA